MKFKSIITVFLIAVLVFSTAISSFALPYNTEMTDTYNFGYFAETFSAPEALRTAQVFDFSALGVDKNFAPVDLLAKNGKLYVVDKGNNTIIILDEQYNVISKIKDLEGTEEYEIPDVIKTIINEKGEEVVDPAMLTANRYGFNAPQGIYVDNDGQIYVADTGNRRIVVCDENGVVSKIIQGVEVSVLGDSYIFQPTKIIVDAAGGLNVLAVGVNRGIMVFDSDGSFRQFLGAPTVSVSAIEWFWRALATEEQKASLAKYVPTEYSNITIDNRGFTYATISTIDATAYAAAAQSYSSGTTEGSPIKKLSASGIDTLRRKGRLSIVGDIYYLEGTSPRVVDVCVNDADIYTMLDQKSGRLFTYSPDGDLLYVGGGYGDQYGRFTNANSIATMNDQIIVSDGATNTLTVFELTDYAKTINEAITIHNKGMYDDAKVLWEKVVSYNSSFYIAYVGMGKAEMRKANNSELTRAESISHYEKALEYFEIANETENYSKAFKELQKESMTKNFGWIVAAIIVVAVGIVLLAIFNKKSKKKKLAAERGGKA